MSCPIVRLAPVLGNDGVWIKGEVGWDNVFSGSPADATRIFNVLRRAINRHVVDETKKETEELEERCRGLSKERDEIVGQLLKERDALNAIVENLQSEHDKINVPGVGFCTNLGGHWEDGKWVNYGWLLPRKEGQRERERVATILDAVRIGIREEQERKEQEDAKSGSAGATDQGSNED